MKVWLDDIRPMPEEYDTWCRTAREAIEALQTGMVEVISFDHDLGDADTNSGYTVACWLEEAVCRGQIPRLCWHVHTTNPVGRANIQAVMESCDRCWDLFDAGKIFD